MTQSDKIKAAKHFGLDKSILRHRALQLALGELEKISPRREYITRILDRWKLRDAFAYYAAKPQAW